ncbi:hypothetical protein AGMMS49936_07230 [Endomicrobiia bacterium]|nr:hypothetical protein AGMMS49936_07230 [Endomicrobiia bacterium]
MTVFSIRGGEVGDDGGEGMAGVVGGVGVEVEEEVDEGSVVGEIEVGNVFDESLESGKGGGMLGAFLGSISNGSDFAFSLSFISFTLSGVACLLFTRPRSFCRMNLTQNQIKQLHLLLFSFSLFTPIIFSSQL